MSGSDGGRPALPHAPREAPDSLADPEPRGAPTPLLSVGEAPRDSGRGTTRTLWSLADVEDRLALHGSIGDARADLELFWLGMRGLSRRAAHFELRHAARTSVHRLEPAYEAKLWLRCVQSAAYRPWPKMRRIHELRVYSYGGSELVGAVGLVGPDDRGFSARDAVRTQALVPGVLAAVSADASFERGTPGHFVMRPDGSIEFASTAGQLWLAGDGFRDELSRLIRALDAHTEVLHEVPRSLLLKDACASWLRLDGASGHGGHRYLVHVRAVVAPGQSGEALTPTQATVAEYLVAGATVKETAASMSISPETVRSHVKNIYSRLEVSSRAELANKLR